LSQFPLGMALDRLGPRRSMSGLFLMAVAGAVLFSLATSFAEAAVAMSLIGIGCSPILMGSMYYFGRTAPPEKFAILGSMVVGFGSFGNLLGSAPLAYAASTIGWRASMVGIAAMTALSALLIFLVIKDPPLVKNESGTQHGFFAGLFAIFSMRPILLMAPFSLISYASIAALRGLWVAPYFGMVHGFDATERGQAALLMAIAMSLGALAYGPMEQRCGGPKPVIAAGCALTLVLLFALYFVGASSAAVSLVLYALLGFFGMSYAIMLAHSRMFFPAHLLGRGVTTMNFLSIGGAGLLQFLSGAFVEHRLAAGYQGDEVYGALHGLIGVLLLAAFLLYLKVPARPAQ
jgi:predicted MFS family arabinose efflux permease